MNKFRLEAHSAIKKDLKKISPLATKEIVNKIFPEIVDNPFIGIQLVGHLKDYFKFVFHFKGVSYRIIYQIYIKEKMVFIIAVGPRGDFYERLIRRIS